MKTTIALAALTVALVATAQAQDDQQNTRPGRRDIERPYRNEDGPQFGGPAGGQDDQADFGPRGPRARWRESGENGGYRQSGSAAGRCPNCGAPLRQRFRQGPGPGIQGEGERGPQFRGGDERIGPRFQGRAESQGRWSPDRPGGPRRQGQDDYGPRGRGYGGPRWQSGDRPDLDQRDSRGNNPDPEEENRD